MEIVDSFNNRVSLIDLLSNTRKSYSQRMRFGTMNNPSNIKFSSNFQDIFSVKWHDYIVSIPPHKAFIQFEILFLLKESDSIHINDIYNQYKELVKVYPNKQTPLKSLTILKLIGKDPRFIIDGSGMVSMKPTN